jgi:hypothetical protein
MLKDFNGFITYAGEVTIKEFYHLPIADKNKYILSLLDKPKEELTTMQKHILKFYTLTPVSNEKFITLEGL